MHTLTLFSAAKINLFLHITGKRLDGYHTLQSVFRTLDFGDTLTFTVQQSPTAAMPLVQLTGANGLTDDVADNLIVKAVYALANHCPTKACPISIHLAKRLPTGAGLGGGSSNCATTLIALNQLWGLNLSPQILIEIGATLGADVPFFVFSYFINNNSKSAIAEGIGEILTAITLPPCHYLLLMPSVHTSTATLFAHPDLVRHHPNYTPERICHANFDDSTQFGNAFEPLVIAQSADIAAAFDYLQALSAHTRTTPRMTGTGSAVFLPLPKLPSADTLHTWQANAPCPSVIAKGL